MAQVAQPHCGTEFVQLCIPTDVRNTFGTVDAEVFQIVELGLQRIVRIANSAAFNGVEDFCGMEGEHGGVSKISGTDAVFCHAKGMCGVINHFKGMPPGNRFDGVCIAKVAVNMDRKNGNGFFGDE